MDPRPKRFAPDLDDIPTLEIPDFRLRAQRVLHLLVGADISPEDYLEKLELIQSALYDVYQEAVSLTLAQHSFRMQQLENQLSRTTRRPAKSTDPGLGPPPIPLPPPVPVELDWSEFEEGTKD